MLHLRELRIKNGLLQAAVARDLGISRQAYNFYENGKRDPDTDTLRAMADYFNVSADYLLGRNFSSSDKKPENNNAEQKSAENFILNNCEKILIKKYRQLSSDAQARIDKLIDFEIFSQNADNAALLEDTGSA